MALQVQPFVFDGPSRRGSPWPPLKMTAKRYRTSNISSVNGLTLLFFHCIGAHKEQWEPVIEYLFSQSQSSSLDHFKIREAWAFDWPTHGEAGFLNQELLEKRTDIVSVYDWVPGIVQFLNSRHVQGHRVVLCGHSAGACTAVHAAIESYSNITSVGISGLILVETSLMTRELFNKTFEDRISQMEFAITAASSRRDKWKSRHDAFLYFQKQFPWSMWDLKVLHLYIEYGLYELDDGTVMLKCDKKREAECFPDVDPYFEGIICLSELCRAMPVHAIWGKGNDLIPNLIQDALNDTSEGRPMASVTKVKRAGHMIVQQQPIGLAEAISGILETIPCISAERSKM